MKIRISQLTPFYYNIKHIPVILFSAMPGIQETFSECEATGFIAKPFDTNILIEEDYVFSSHC